MFFFKLIKMFLDLTFKIPTQIIFPHTLTKQVSKSNKIAITYLCKKSCCPQAQCKCCKNKVKCSQYYHLTRQNCSTTNKVKRDTDAAIVSKSENEMNNPQTSLIF